jgi:hypothetical protein
LCGRSLVSFHSLRSLLPLSSSPPPLYNHDRRGGLIKTPDGSSPVGSNKDGRIKELEFLERWGARCGLQSRRISRDKCRNSPTRRGPKSVVSLGRPPACGTVWARVFSNVPR